MITLLELFGQTSNNFIQHIHLDAFCRSQGIKFYNPQLRKHFHTYPNLAKAGYHRSKLYMKLRNKFPYSPIVHFDAEGKQDLYRQQLLQGGDVYCEGWYFRTPDDVIGQYLPLYRELFRPGFSTADLDANFLQRPNGEAIIGLHVRRGDYKTWFGGIFYYEDEVYIDKVRQLIGQLDRPAKVILFTNDPGIDLFAYRRAFRNVLLSGNSAAADHHLMSQCDYILGAPSTFSKWASFLGEAPYLHISSDDMKITPGDFRVFRGN